MAELRVDPRGQGPFQVFDSFRNHAQPFGVLLRSLPTFVVADNGKSFTEGSGELG